MNGARLGWEAEDVLREWFLAGPADDSSPGGERKIAEMKPARPWEGD